MNNDCENCKWHYIWAEHFFSASFIGSDNWGEKWSEKLFFPPVTMCQHKNCFEKTKRFRERIKGQYQLNKNNDCPYYKKKWYLFWK